MPGPARKANPLRRNIRPDYIQLPREGRQGPPPAWPLPGAAPAPAEVELWRSLWTTPQATQWQTLGAGTVRIVASYVRNRIRAEQPSAQTPLLAECRHQEATLGLTPSAMRSLQWEIAPPVASFSGDAPAATVTQITEFRNL